MCGIVGYVGKDTERVLIEKLKQLEYRGYDSAGIAVKAEQKINVFKAKGEIKNLEKTIVPLNGAQFGIGHTRWATHGKPDEINAHPHVSSDDKWVIVHNGIIENYLEIKDELTKKGMSFYSETDTETVAKLLEFHSRKVEDKMEIISETCDTIKGSYALAILNKETNGIYFAKNKSPLFIAKKDENVMIASDVICFYGFADEYYSVEDGEIGYTDANTLVFKNKFGEVVKNPIKCDFGNYNNANTYKHFMIKEIYETKNAIKNIIEYYSQEENRNRILQSKLDGIKRIKIVGCGTAYHAGLMGSKIFEEKLGIECTAYVASEFRYQDPKIGDDTLVILISQSGETADTLAAHEISKQKGAVTLALVNVEYSALAKSADISVPIKAGVEVAVASTKAYSSQLTVLYILAGLLREKFIGDKFNMADVEKLYNEFDYGNINNFKLLADIFQYNDKMFMIGRGADYCTAQEASLKIKETSYINSDTYYAGELKHGFLALIDEKTYVVVFATEKNVLSKTLCNAEEAKARGAKIILFTCFDLEPSLTENFYFVIKVKELGNALQAVLNIVPWQIIAYYTSVNKGYNPDKPRNLAKSVTVE